MISRKSKETSTPIKPIAIHLLERELHMISNCVAVCWNTKNEPKTIEKDGIKYSADARVRSGKPYIDFVTVREFSGSGNEKVLAEDEDKPCIGGMSAASALAFAKELTKAAEYLKQIENK